MVTTASPISEIFEKACPSYLAMGMPLQEYWDGDPMAAKYYREAHEIKKTQKNYELWLQGAYIFEAVSLAVGNAFRKKGAKATGYSEKPYPVTALEQCEEARKQKEKAQCERIRAKMEAFAARWKGGEKPDANY